VHFCSFAFGLLILVGHKFAARAISPGFVWGAWVLRRQTGCQTHHVTEKTSHTAFLNTDVHKSAGILRGVHF
jgi:hypothetical protein